MGEFTTSGVIKRKIHTIAWAKLLEPKKIGGLNISKLQDRNIAVIGKWWWRLYHERDRFWHSFLQTCTARKLGLIYEGYLKF